jgi:hypothetical protein
MQYLLYTVMVFDEWHNGVPVVYVITSRCQEEDILAWLSKLRDRVIGLKPEWMPNAVIVDCVQVELNCITYTDYQSLSEIQFVFLPILEACLQNSCSNISHVRCGALRTTLHWYQGLWSNVGKVC